MPIQRLFIANRGEIAVRIIRAARELGVRTIQAYSDADADSLAVQMADESARVGPPHAARSYLSIDAVIAAAREAGADAVHPGYGFLAESADFAAAVEAADLSFVGPRPDTIRQLGDKVAARAAAAASGVPTVPGSAGRIETEADARAAVAEIGFPMLIKAAAGGGGRGIRIARDQAEFDRLAPQARAEAQAAFGDGGLFVERCLVGARHVEVQILGDGDRVVHLYERECSLQRRRQKIWEEAPAAALSERVRGELCEAAAAFASAVGYRGAGTLEFLYDEADERFYFLEMNARIQVEHPVTELVTGVDLVREGIRIAGGEGLRLRQEEIRIRGHAIECRINAEDPANGFFPNPGTVTGLRSPGGPGVRFDAMLYPGCQVPPFYDSLLGKLIVWDETRPAALARMERALRELEIAGLRTTKSLHQALARDPDIRRAAMHTGFLDEWIERESPRLAASGEGLRA